MFCTHCGSSVPQGAAFCGECGQAHAAAAPAPAMPVVSAPSYQPPAPPIPAPAAATPVRPAPPPLAAVPRPPIAPPPAYAPPVQSFPPPLPPPAYAPPPPITPPVMAAPPQGYPPPPQFAPIPPPLTPPPGMNAGYPPPPIPQQGFPLAGAPAFAAGPMPPQMHWAVVLILSFFTGGLAGLIWAFRQAAFVKKIDPASKAMVMLFASLGLMALQVVLYIAIMSSPSSAATLSGLIMLLNLAIVAVGLMAIFGMRKSIVRYYNTVEPIQLQLSGVMTVFFSILYFQYHFSRIVQWKTMGRLS